MKCLYCGSTDRLHVYGETDPDFSRDLVKPEKLYACACCDPILTPNELHALRSRTDYAEHSEDHDSGL